MERDNASEIDLEFFVDHFNMFHPTYAEQHQQAIPHLLQECPDTRSDAFEGRNGTSSRTRTLAWPRGTV